MKHVFYVLFGIALFAAIGFIIGSLGTNWYANYVAKSDDDINASVRIFLVLWLLLCLAGAYVGHCIYTRKRRRNP